MAQDLHHLSERRETAFRTAVLPPADEILDLPEEPALFDQRHQAAGGVEEKREKRDRSVLLPDDPARLAPDRGEPGGDLFAVADRRRQEQQVDPDGR